MIINILGGGPENLLPNLKQYDSKDCVWLGVDRGVFILLASEITPDYAFGDFDSVTAQELEQIEKRVSNLRRFKPEKDKTDMELALDWAITQNPKQINIFGATGGRLDHLFGNVQILLKPELKNMSIPIEIIDKQNHLFIKGPGSHPISRLQDKNYISFVPVTPVVKGLTLDGFKYPLKNCHISIGSTLCISNELESDYGTFSFSDGLLLVIRSRD